MCGRFVRAMPAEEIASFFDALPPAEPLAESYNVAPTTDVYAVTASDAGERAVEVFRWGLVPHWAKGLKVGAKMINARAETLATKPAFKSVFRKHRALIPMDGYYEWQRTAEGKQPMFIHHRSEPLLAAAGLWSAWHDPDTPADAPLLYSCSIVTTAADGELAAIHDRMPVFLPAAAWEAWLDPDHHDLGALESLLGQALRRELVFHPVSSAVNSVRNRGPELITPLADDRGSPAQQPPSLFD